MAEVKHRGRLYLQFPAQPSALIEAQLAQAVAGADAACVLICPDESPVDEIHAGRLVDLVQGRGLACLIENDIELAERLGTDGAHIEADPAAYTEARKRLGESASISAGYGLTHHDAMLLAALGADFVAPSRKIWRGDEAPRLIAEIDSAVRQARRAA